MKKEMTPRKRQALEMRAKIQNTALSLFGREGFENVSAEEIAQAVGCSVGNIYHYFKSRDELAIQVTQMVDRAYAEMEQEYLSDGDTPAREKLLDFVGRSLEISASDEMLYKAFIHGLRYPEQTVLKKNDTRVYFHLLRRLVNQCQEEGSIHPSYDPDCRDRGGACNYVVGSVRISYTSSRATAQLSANTSLRPTRSMARRGPVRRRYAPPSFRGSGRK